MLFRVKFLSPISTVSNVDTPMLKSSNKNSNNVYIEKVTYLDRETIEIWRIPVIIME